MVTALLVSLAMLLIFSIVPSMNELAAILVFGIVSIVFLLAYFAIALMMSTVSSDGGSALICTLVIFFILGSLLPIVGGTVAHMVSGDIPKSPVFDILHVTNVSEGLSSSSVTTPYGDEAPGLQKMLGKVWKNILALIIFSVVFFALAYVKFMRLDIR